MNGSAGSSRPKNQKQELTGSNGAVPTSKTESGDRVVGLAVRIVESVWRWRLALASRLADRGGDILGTPLVYRAQPIQFTSLLIRQKFTGRELGRAGKQLVEPGLAEDHGT